MSEYGDRFRRQLWMSEREGWKLIRGTDGTTELFDVARDPAERENLAARHPARVAALEASIREHFDERALPVARDRESEILDEDTREQLRSLGYLK